MGWVDEDEFKPTVLSALRQYAGCHGILATLPIINQAQPHKSIADDENDATTLLQLVQKLAVTGTGQVCGGLDEAAAMGAS